MFVLIALVHVLLFACFIYTYRVSKKLEKLPPGPRGIPILGNSLQLVKNTAEQLSKWEHQYGKLYTIRMGNDIPALVISDAALINQIFGHVSSTGKLHSDLFKIIFQGEHGVQQSEGKIWLEQRAFFVKVLKRFGLDKGHRIESLILSEVDDLCDHFQREMKTKGQTKLRRVLTDASGNTLWTIIIGENMKTNVAELVGNWEKTFQNAANHGLGFFSWMKFIAPTWSGYDAYVTACSDIHNFLQRHIDDHKNVRKGGSPYHQDVIHEYIDKVESTKDENSSFFGRNGLCHTLNSITALLLAGVTTTASNLHWALFYLAAHPEIQRKVHEEIWRVVGPNRSLSLNDRPRMPYTEAVIEETLRKASSVPFGAIHRLMDDITVGGYKLPKDLLLIPNLYHVHHDPAVWGDPERFRPERFLEDKRVNLREYVIQFLPGRRTCPGEFIARDTMFLFLTGVINKFCISPDTEIEGQEYLHPERGYMLMPKDLNVLLTQRKPAF